MRWHLIAGEEGCAYAREHACTALVVDALRASTTAAIMLHHGAREILMVREVDEARAAKRHWPDALLCGERNALPPEGFDYGNSPRETPAAKGRRVIFTTTTGAGRMVAAWGAPAVAMAAPVNAAAAAAWALKQGHDVVVVPAGLMGDPDFDAQEDWVGAAAVVMAAEGLGAVSMGEGADAYRAWRARIEAEGIPKLFESAPHAEKMRRAGVAEDIPFCAQCDITDAVPVADAEMLGGVRVRNGTRP